MFFPGCLLHSRLQDSIRVPSPRAVSGTPCGRKSVEYIYRQRLETCFIFLMGSNVMT